MSERFTMEQRQRALEDCRAETARLDERCNAATMAMKNAYRETMNGISNGPASQYLVRFVPNHDDTVEMVTVPCRHLVLSIKESQNINEILEQPNDDRIIATATTMDMETKEEIVASNYFRMTRNVKRIELMIAVFRQVGLYDHFPDDVVTIPKEDYDEIMDHIEPTMIDGIHAGP